MKQAFPNFDEFMPMKPVYNIRHWMDAMRDVYVRIHLGASRNQAISAITTDWKTTEKTDFLNWMRYYESGDQNKYKKAQNNSYYVNDDLNYFIPNPPKQQAPSPLRTVNDQITNAPQEAANLAAKQQAEEEKRQNIEDLRRKILGRLNSAEKLLSSQQGHMFAGTDFERLLSAIFELKKQIQIVNKVSMASIQTITDLIVRQANILRKEGYVDASGFMVKLAQQTPGDMSLNLGEIPAGGSIPQGGGMGNNAPNLNAPPGGGMADPTAGAGSNKITEDSAVGKFVDNLEDSGITDTPDEEQAEDKAQVDDNDVEIDQDDVILDQKIAGTYFDSELMVEAQAIPEDAPPAPTPKKQESKPQDNGGLTPENAKKAPNPEVAKNDFDDIIDSAFANLTVQDVITKMDQIGNIFRTREIARQIAVCDLMLDRLGIAQYFPEISEILNKNLDAGQYSLLRLENILSRLKGSIKTPEMDLEGKNQKLAPGAEAIKTNLEQQDQKEKQRKEVKKQLSDQADMDKATKPDAEVENVPGEIAAQPLEVESPAPAPTEAPAPRPRPATAPTV